MIELSVAKCNIGKSVDYRPGVTGAERGVIAAVSDAGWIFVRYGTDEHAKATHPADLYWAGE